MPRSKISSFFIAAAVILAAYGLLRFPQEVSQAILEGMALCANTLLPSLFPFFVLSSVVIKSGLSQQLGQKLAPVMGPLFHLPGSCACALVLGLIGGYPTGARTAATLYKEGQCTRKEAQQLLSFCCACSPAFLLGAVGTGAFGSTRCGLLLLGTHWASALLVGLLLNRGSPVPEQSSDTFPSKSQPIILALTDSIKESLRNLLDLFSFVLCFSALGRLLALTRLPEQLAALLLPSLSGDNGVVFLNGLLDMPRCVTMLSDGNITERLILSAALLAWGGVSIHFQIVAILQEYGLSPVSYLQGKLLHSIICAILTATVLGIIAPTPLLFTCGILFILFLLKKEVTKPRKTLYNEDSKQREL